MKQTNPSNLYLLAMAVSLLLNTVHCIVPFNTTSSRDCRINCINKFENFCSNVDFTEGTCCDWTGADCRNFGICSNDIGDEKRNTGLEYWTCPREDFCGEQFIIVGQDEEELIIDNVDF